jgi:hypothetical protein
VDPVKFRGMLPTAGPERRLQQNAFDAAFYRFGHDFEE